MGCYVIPAATAIMHYFMRKKISYMKGKKNVWLNLLFLGGSIFGVVDHLWNRELFVFSISDVLLGFVITLAILIAWGIIVLYEKSTVTKVSTTQKT